MVDLEDLNAVGTRLERLHADRHYPAILPILDRLFSAPVSVGDLQQTTIAQYVFGLKRGCADASVRAKARSLLCSWKRICAPSCDPEDDNHSSPETKRSKFLSDAHNVVHGRTASEDHEGKSDCADYRSEQCYARSAVDASGQSLQRKFKDICEDQKLSVSTTGGDNAADSTACELSEGNSLMAVVLENVHPCAQSGNVRSCAQALKADTVTGKVNVTQCNRAETDPRTNELPENVNVKPAPACNTQEIRDKGIELLYKGLLGIDTRSLAPSGSRKPFCGSTNNIAECPELSQDGRTTLVSHNLGGYLTSCGVPGSTSATLTGPRSGDSSGPETKSSEYDGEGEKRHLLQLAREIERAILALHPSVDRKYRACLRSKIANLRDPRNGELAVRVKTGAVSPARFATMTLEEMACSELRHLRDAYRQAALREHQLPHRPGGTRTDRVRCRRCGKFNCSVSVISRGTLFIPGWVRGDSPDEQLMTFLTCEECGEKWYNSGWMVG